MPIRLGRIVLLAVAVEVTAIAILVLLVALFGPPDPGAALAWAERTGRWVGPVAGFALCGAGGWLAARRLPSHHVRNGLALGACVAAIDVAILVASDAPFATVFVVSNIGRVAAGALGGRLARRGARGAARPSAPAEAGR